MFNIEKYLSNMNEEELFRLMSTRYTGLIDLNEKDPSSLIDWHYPENDVWMESKCRKDHHGGVLWIEQIKFNALIEKENSWYVNSTPKGIYVWIIQNLKIDELNWRSKYLPETTQFGTTEYKWKTIADVYVDKCDIQLDHLLF